MHRLIKHAFLQLFFTPPILHWEQGRRSDSKATQSRTFWSGVRPITQNSSLSCFYVIGPSIHTQLPPGSLPMRDFTLLQLLQILLNEPLHQPTSTRGCYAFAFQQLRKWIFTGIVGEAKATELFALQDMVFI